MKKVSIMKNCILKLILLSVNVLVIEDPKIELWVV